MKGALIAVVAGLVVAAAPALAHHGWSDYDADKPTTLKGTVKVSHYGSPHATITLDADGRTTEVILAPVSRMESRGAPRESVAVGRVVTVTGYPSRSNATEMRAERIVVRNGDADKTVELR